MVKINISAANFGKSYSIKGVLNPTLFLKGAFYLNLQVLQHFWSLHC